MRAQAAHAGDALHVEIAAIAPGRYEVRGALTFATARLASERGVAAFSAAGPHAIEVSCARLAAADSAGLAVLLYWLAWARRERRTLRLTSLPAEVIGVARISDVQTLLEHGVVAGEPIGGAARAR